MPRRVDAFGLFGDKVMAIILVEGRTVVCGCVRNAFKARAFKELHSWIDL
jgi:hypothetical protein